MPDHKPALVTFLTMDGLEQTFSFERFKFRHDIIRPLFNARVGKLAGIDGPRVRAYTYYGDHGINEQGQWVLTYMEVER